jgi:drug/metabolite transporter (DMT)-like permease
MTYKKSESLPMIVLAFAAVYIIWGSTYFFIERAVRHLPPMFIGSLRFSAAAVIMMIWAKWKGEKLWNKNAILYSLASGVLMLFIGNGAVIWGEQYLHSSFVAIFLASSPIWFLVLDRPQWKQNFSSKLTLIGVFFGLLGVIALFYEKLVDTKTAISFIPLLVVSLGNVGWTMGSLVSKYRVKNISPSVNTAWQMIAGAVSFGIVGIFDQSFVKTNWSTIPFEAWFSIGYLILFGSVLGFSAYVYLLEHRNPTQVSSYAYVNPLVAVILGVFLNHEKITLLQYGGLSVILFSVLFINTAKRRKNRKASRERALYADAETV